MALVRLFKFSSGKPVLVESFCALPSDSFMCSKCSPSLRTTEEAKYDIWLKNIHKCIPTEQDWWFQSLEASDISRKVLAVNLRIRNEVDNPCYKILTKRAGSGLLEKMLLKYEKSESSWTLREMKSGNRIGNLTLEENINCPWGFN